MKKLTKFNINEIKEAFGGKVFALTPATAGDRWAAGVAVANEAGYCPLPATWCNIEQGPGAYKEISDYLDTVNSELGTEELVAAKIVASTMVAQNRMTS